MMSNIEIMPPNDGFRDDAAFNDYFGSIVDKLDTDPYAVDGTDQGAVVAGDAAKQVLQGLLIATRGKFEPYPYESGISVATGQNLGVTHIVKQSRFNPAARRGKGTTLEIELRHRVPAGTPPEEALAAGRLSAEVRTYPGQLPEPIIVYSIDAEDRQCSPPNLSMTPDDEETKLTIPGSYQPEEFDGMSEVWTRYVSERNDGIEDGYDEDDDDEDLGQPAEPLETYMLGMSSGKNSRVATTVLSRESSLEPSTVRTLAHCLVGSVEIPAEDLEEIEEQHVREFQERSQ